MEWPPEARRGRVPKWRGRPTHHAKSRVRVIIEAARPHASDSDARPQRAKRTIPVVSSLRPFACLAALACLAAVAAAEPPPPAQALDPGDPVSVLYGRRLTFARGEPHVTVRVLEGRDAFTFRPTGAVRVTPRGDGQAVTSPARGAWRVRVVKAKAGRSVTRVEVGEHLFSDAEGAEADARLFRAHGYQVAVLSVGTVYGIAGRTVDTRRLLVLLEADGTDEGARRLAQEVEKRFNLRPALHKEPLERGHGLVEVVSPQGQVVARSPDALSIDVDGAFTIERVEHDVGYASHGFENRRYSGRLYAVVDAAGKLAAVNLVSLESLTRGIVPSEIFASAHPEALKAQAVTARGELLAKVGARHVGDPYLLCAEQHCQVFRGASGEHRRTNRAVDETRGEALFGRDGRLVPSFYSAMCGGHTEDNDAVWGGPPDASIRGRPDFPITEATAPFAEGIGEALLRRWLAADVPSFCATASSSRSGKYRWTRSFTQREVDTLASVYGVGKVASLEVEGRGISGRAKTLVLKGDAGEARVHSELSIRRLFRMLPSGMFVIDVQGEGAARRFVFTGGGWGHGAGMCQMGAIGRAEKGASYREVLSHYYGGAEVVRMYE